jgi:hypothetical protein
VFHYLLMLCFTIIIIKSMIHSMIGNPIIEETYDKGPKVNMNELFKTKLNHLLSNMAHFIQ